MQTHHQYAATHKPPRPCTAHDLNFGGECFNCGYVPQPERRQSSPEYRERINQIALNTAAYYGDDLDLAAERAEHAFATSKGSGRLTGIARDVATLLRRRAETVKGMRVP